MKKTIAVLLGGLMLFSFAFADIIDMNSIIVTRDNYFYVSDGGHGRRVLLFDFLGMIFTLLIPAITIIIPLYLFLTIITDKIKKRETNLKPGLQAMGIITGSILIWCLLSNAIILFEGNFTLGFGLLALMIPVIYMVVSIIKYNNKKGERKSIAKLSLVFAIIIIVGIVIKIVNSIDLRIKLSDFKEENPEGYSSLIEDIKNIQKNGTFLNAELVERKEEKAVNGIQLPSMLYKTYDAVGNGYKILDGGSVIINGEKVYTVKPAPYQKLDIFNQIIHDYFTSYLW